LACDFVLTLLALKRTQLFVDPRALFLRVLQPLLALRRPLRFALHLFRLLSRPQLPSLLCADANTHSRGSGYKPKMGPTMGGA
jgi:hypothetical protein